MFLSRLHKIHEDAGKTRIFSFFIEMVVSYGL